MLLRIDDKKPDKRRIQQVVDILRSGGVIIYPTDTVYTLGCDIYNNKAYHRICELKRIVPKKAKFSLVCYDLSHASNYCKNIPNPQFRLMKRVLPGPFTFILDANKEVHKLFGYKRNELGIRIPKHTITQEIINTLGHPIISASIKHEDEILEYMTDPEDIWEIYQQKVDLVIDAGFGGNIASTIVDLRSGETQVLREGLGVLEDLC